jgi:hypothetical protein
VEHNLADLPRSLLLSAPTTWIAIIAALAFLALGVRGLVDPAGAAASFGIPLTPIEGVPQRPDFMRSTGARNIGLALLALALIAIDAQHALALLILSAAAIAALDWVIVAQAQGPGAAVKHSVYVIGLVAFGLWLWARP